MVYGGMEHNEAVRLEYFCYSVIDLFTLIRKTPNKRFNEYKTVIDALPCTLNELLSTNDTN